MVKPKLFLPDDHHYAYVTPFLSIFDIAPNLTQADVLILTGGEDVSPELYGEKPGRRTYCDAARDAKEQRLYHSFVSRKRPILGICRGAQLMCVMQGGKLAQHIENHAIYGGHRMMTSTGEEVHMSSAHHQMMLLKNTKHELLAWTELRSPVHLDGWDRNIPGIEVEPEVVMFPDIKGLGIQGHPEYLPDNHPANLYVRRLVKERLLEQ